MVSKLPTTTCTLVCLRVEHYTSWIGADFIWYLFIRINGANNPWNYCHNFFSWMTNIASCFNIPMLLTKLRHCHNTWFCLIRLILLKLNVRFNGYSERPLKTIRINTVVVADTVAPLLVDDCLALADFLTSNSC